jgi:2-keto-4-pentenoate hydratase/2-oxohepta-3-ene-1,7-dioic acid hydratase in catechol pathway
VTDQQPDGLARLGEPGAEIPVLVHEGVAYDLRGIARDVDGAFLAADGIGRARAAAAAGELPALEGADAMRVGAPIATPGKIVCIGLNYSDHAAESGLAIPAEPVVFMKDPTTIVGPFDRVLVPRGSTKTDWEVELGVVVGSEMRYLASPEDALARVAGYVLSHDVSEREFQLDRGGQWDKGKSCETFNPLGTRLVPADAVDDPQALGMRLSVNGTLRQDGSSADMIFPVAHVLWYLSQFMVLRPGDLVNTGTPAGVGLGMATPEYLRDGDVVELSIDGLGSARQQLGQA